MSRCEMHIIPFQTGPASYNVFVVIEDDNLARMREYDPAQFGLDRLPPEWGARRLGMVIIGYPSPKDLAQVQFLLQAGEVGRALKFLTRGFKFDPAQGDSDEPYRSALSTSKGEHP